LSENNVTSGNSDKFQLVAKQLNIFNYWICKVGNIKTEKYCLRSKDVVQTAIDVSNKDMKEFEVDQNVIIIFSGGLLNYLKGKANLKESDWLNPYHPYGGGNFHRGKYKNIPLTVVLPSMGASTMSTLAEDLIYCGAKVILLVCGSWGIGKNVKLLDYLIPTHGFGPDGTTIHYGRNINEEIELNKEIIDIFIKETKKRTNSYHIGKNYSKEAFYQINKPEIIELQKKGCISMENGEINVLATVCNKYNIQFSAIFYSYYNPLEGWKVSWRDNRYKDCVDLEGDIALETIKKLKRNKNFR
jgi:uridine phosphorylase